MTIIKSFKISAHKHQVQDSFVKIIPCLGGFIQSKELPLKQASFEALAVIGNNKNLNGLLKTCIDDLIKFALQETPIKPELVEEINLGPFKHKVDHGAPIRKASFDFLQSVIQVYPTSQAQIVQATISGFSDSSEDVQLQTLFFMSRMIEICPMVVLTQLQAMVDQFTQLYGKMMNDLKQDK